MPAPSAGRSRSARTPGWGRPGRRSWPRSRSTGPGSGRGGGGCGRRRRCRTARCNPAGPRRRRCQGPAQAGSCPADAVLVIDESGQEKAGEHTAGVKRRYLGCAGRVANGINVVYASYAAAAGHAVIAARLYVPREWADDQHRSRAAGPPEDLEPATKPQLAAGIITQLLAEGRCPPWVTGDDVHGRDAGLRPVLEGRHTGHVLTIPCSFRVTLPDGQKMRTDHAARLVPARARQTASAGRGSKGGRDYRRAWLATASPRPHLLIRRRRRPPRGRVWLLCLGPAGRVWLFPPAGGGGGPPRAGGGSLPRRKERFRPGGRRGPPLHRLDPAPGPGHGRA